MDKRVDMLGQMKQYMHNMLIEPDSTCCICFCNFEKDEELVEMPCFQSHVFHYECIEDWVKHGHDNCPICR
jgi:hypothetical protein